METTTKSNGGRKATPQQSEAARIALIERDAPAPIITVLEPAQEADPFNPEDYRVGLHLMKGRPAVSSRILAKQINDARSDVYSLKNPADECGEKITGSDKKGTVVIWEGHGSLPCETYRQLRSQAIIKAANNMHKALAISNSKEKIER